MNIKRITGKIIKIIDLSKTAKEISIKLSEPLEFIPGSFVNIFFDINGEKVRRAYSISSSYNDHENITLSIRLSPTGTVTPIFWGKDMTGENIDIMGPLGLNTVDKMNANKIYLFAFGIGIGVVKSITDYYINSNKIENLTIISGSRNIDEILYNEYFKKISDSNKNVSFSNVVSNGTSESEVRVGYIQDFVGDFDFNNSDIYVCGQEKACNDLVKKINSLGYTNYNFFIEGFH
jgi:ring-1,2-phenylacetyl-CoA epoxidase subunit PaaE